MIHNLIHPRFLMYVVSCAIASALQDSAQTTFTSNVVSKNTKAVNYQHRMGATAIDFRGTAIMPKALGKGKVESRAGRIEISLEIRGLEQPTKFGLEFLTYVLWAVTPEGRPRNLGEIQISRGSGKLSATSEMQVFGLIVTAEPHFAVTMPSDRIVAENELREDTLGRFETIDAKLELLQSRQYATLSNPIGTMLDPKIPLELYQARNALLIAKSVEAQQFAPEVMAKAEKSLVHAEAYQSRNAGSKPVAMMARDSVQRSEDARALAVQRAEEERVKKAKQELEAREISAKDSFEKESKLRANAEMQRREAEQLRRIEETRRIEAERQKSSAEAEAVRREEARAQEEQKRINAESISKKLAADKANLEEAARKIIQQAEQAQKSLEEARSSAERAEKEKDSIRNALLKQFNLVFETRSTERGLVVNLGDLLFGVGRATLGVDARERLARLAGLALAYPGIKLMVEGHTETTGSEISNQRLSLARAESVRAYLESQGIPIENLKAYGYGGDLPIADNLTLTGRRTNRRVEIVVSGEVIGTTIGPSTLNLKAFGIDARRKPLLLRGN